MAASEDGPRALAVLVLLSRFSQLEELAALVGVTPERSWERGSVRGRSAGATHEYSGVEVRSTCSRGESAEAHVDDLLARLEGATDRLRAFAAEAAVRDPATIPVRVWVYVESNSDETAVDLRSDQVLAIGRLGAALGLNVGWLERKARQAQ